MAISTTIAGAAVVEGPKYDIGRVIDAAECVIDALSSRLGRGRSYVTTDRPPFTKRIPWPEPGRELARSRWIEMAKLYETVDEALVHGVGEMTVKAFLLGKTWCVRHADGSVTLPDGVTPVSRIENEPTLCLYGSGVDDRPGSYGVLTSERMREVRAILRAVVRLPFRLEVMRLGAPGGGGATHQVGFLRFPHEHYGDGTGPIRVRCVPYVPSERRND